MDKNVVGLRKGAWSKEEDHLLTKCIHKHGEGRWHLVPLRAVIVIEGYRREKKNKYPTRSSISIAEYWRISEIQPVPGDVGNLTSDAIDYTFPVLHLFNAKGLNRCRKSCRLRWLNYLIPNIKRGSFDKDEIDLIFRLHKLLGNRWSLIAGRIPGRTANNVKNFWNTYVVDKKPSAPQVDSIVTKSNNIIKPLPRVFSPKQPDEKNKSLGQLVLQEEGDQENECMRWWSSLLDINENENMSGAPFLFPEDELPPLPNMISHGSHNHAIDIDQDADLWEFFSMDI